MTGYPPPAFLSGRRAEARARQAERNARFIGDVIGGMLIVAALLLAIGVVIIVNMAGR